jgi:Flp pilus assembly protein TadB
VSTLVATLILLAVLGFSLTALFWQIGRARRVESERDRIIREAHQRADQAREWDDIALAWDLPAYTGPEPAAALERLRQDINDQQTNTTEGD